MAFVGLFAFGCLLMASAQTPKGDSPQPAANDTTLVAGNDTLTADSAMALIDADRAGAGE